jgi:hyperosmotically inducible protein
MKKYNKQTFMALMAGVPLALGIVNAKAADYTNVDNSMGANTNSDSSKAVDNSQQNQRDRDGRTQLPTEPGNSRDDVRITREIRQSVVSSTNNFSIMAHNVKIITVDGQVTLRGPVKTDEEKSDIVGIARGIAGPSNVNDLLEVKNESNP